MFRGDMLKNHEWMLTYNPFYYFIELVRKPLLGDPAPVGEFCCCRPYDYCFSDCFCIFLGALSKENNLLGLNKNMAFLNLVNVGVDIPVYDISSRSFKVKLIAMLVNFSPANE